MGRRDRGPDLDGVLVVDKPAGMTSHDVVQVVRRAAGQRKVGHTGTLDPDATGVLVVCLGRATRLVRFLQTGTKTYDATMTLGVATTTQDTSGDVVAERDASGVDEQLLTKALGDLVGDIEQIPPMVSAVKVGGERLHAKARRGEEVERDPRAVTVHDLHLTSFTPGARADASFTVTCSSGTYVRTLAHDAGEALGVGAALASLRRTANSGFELDDAVPLDTVRARGEDGSLETLLLGLREAAGRLPTVVLDDPAMARRLTNGAALDAQGIDGPYAVVFGDRLVGVYADRDGQGRAEAVLARPDELPASASAAPSHEDPAP